MRFMTDALRGNSTESALDWTASLLFAALIAYACWLVGGAKLAAMGAAAGFMTGAGALALVTSDWPPLPTFEVEAFDALAALDDDELLLDDPLDAPDEGSRVVALFAPTDHTPAALVARIEDYLGRDPQRGSLRQADDDAALPARTVDASAALHAALSNIRASLR